MVNHLKRPESISTNRVMVAPNALWYDIHQAIFGTVSGGLG